METILLNALVGNYRHEVVNGREYIVAPLVSIVPGVLNGSKGALFYPEDEIRRDPQAWNGMPIVKGHPTKNGQHVSGRDPWVRQHLQIGTIYNSVYDGRLQHEAWFDVEDTKRVDNWVYQQLVANKPIEVSTGLFTDNEPNKGTFNNKPYDYVARNYRPDHMAILVGQRGACSNDDGCGVNVNANPEGCNQYKSCDGGGESEGEGKPDPLKDLKDSAAPLLAEAWKKGKDAGTDSQGTRILTEKQVRGLLDKHGDKLWGGSITLAGVDRGELGAGGSFSRDFGLTKWSGGRYLITKLSTENTEQKRSIWTKLGELLGLTDNGSNPIAAIKEAGEWLNKNGLMPGYGQIFLKENGSGEVWYVGGDGDERGFDKVVKDKLLAIEGIDEVRYEAEAFPPENEGWVKVFKGTLNAGVYGNPQSTVTGKFKRHGAGTGKGEVHESAQRGAMTLDDVDRQRGASAKAELEQTGHNPASWVADEDTWEKAKDAADKGNYSDDEYWAVVSHIYKKMGGEVKGSTDNSNPEGCNQYKDCGGGGDVVNTLKEMHTKNDVENWTFEKINNLTAALGQMKGTELKEAVTNIYGKDRDYMAKGGKKDIIERVTNDFKERIASYNTGKQVDKAMGINSAAEDLRDCQEECDDDEDCIDECLDEFIGNNAAPLLTDLVVNANYPWPQCIEDQKKKGEDEESADKICGSIKAANNQEKDMPTRTEAINHLVTNCDCWKGKQEVLANKDSFTDEDIQRLLKSFNARKLAVNTLREIGVAVAAPATLTVNEMPAFIKAKMGKKEDDEEDAADSGMDEEEEGEPPVKNSKTKKPTKPAPITERLSSDELEVWNNAVKITANEKKKIVSQLVANLEGDYRKEKYKKLMTKNMDDLREMLELRGTNNSNSDDNESFVSNGIGGFFTPDFDDSTTTRTTDNADDDGPPLGLPSSMVAAK